MNIQTRQRIDVDLSLNSDEATALSNHLEATLNENSDNNLLALHNSLQNAITPKAKPGPKPKNSSGEGSVKADGTPKAKPGPKPKNLEPAPVPTTEGDTPQAKQETVNGVAVQTKQPPPQSTEAPKTVAKAPAVKEKVPANA